MRRSCLALGFLIVVAHTQAQVLVTPPADVVSPIAPATTPRDTDSPRVFKAGVDLVALSVVVTDAQHRFITGLTAPDFAVFEDGVQQDVTFFAATDVPLDLALLIDTSASMKDKMQTMQEAALGFLSTLRGGDRAAVLEIKENVRIAYPLGDDVKAAGDAVRGTTAFGGTALFNGLYLGIKEMVKQRKANGEVRRQAIVALSDGEDTASLVAYDDVMDLAKQSGIAIYTITIRSPMLLRQGNLTGRRYFSQSEFAMKALAQETGARSFFPDHLRDLAGVYDSIATELAHQYAIGYSSKNGRRDGAFRRVIVRVADRPDARARTRPGYLATRHTTDSSSVR